MLRTLAHALALLPALLPAQAVAPRAPDEPRWVVTAVPAELELDEFYAKHVSVGGYPIVSSALVDDHALLEAAFLVDRMLSHKQGLIEAMIASGSRLVVMDHTEFTSDVPEYHWLKPSDWWDRRARGLGGSATDPIASCAEENLLGYEGAPYSTECITIHEFAHNLHLRGMARLEPAFDERVEAAFLKAMDEGLWAGTYAATNHHEYWAEAVQSWFDTNRSNDHDHGEVDTRDELKEYDARVAALCEEIFGDDEWRYTRPETRLTGHLEGYDPGQAPRFEWPERLKNIDTSKRPKR